MDFRLRWRTPPLAVSVFFRSSSYRQRVTYGHTRTPVVYFGSMSVPPLPRHPADLPDAADGFQENPLPRKAASREGGLSPRFVGFRESNEGRQRYWRWRASPSSTWEQHAPIQANPTSHEDWREAALQLGSHAPGLLWGLLRSVGSPPASGTSSSVKQAESSPSSSSASRVPLYEHIGQLLHQFKVNGAARGGGGLVWGSWTGSSARPASPAASEYRSRRQPPAGPFVSEPQTWQFLRAMRFLQFAGGNSPEELGEELWWCVGELVRSPEASREQVGLAMSWLLPPPGAARREKGKRLALELERAVGSILQSSAAVPANVVAMVRALQEPHQETTPSCGGSATTASIATRWHPLVTPSLAKMCLQRLLKILHEEKHSSDGGGGGPHRNGKGAGLTAVTLGEIFRCVMCRFPAPLEGSSDPTVDGMEVSRTELALLAMSCLKYGAPYAQLCALYAYFESEDRNQPVLTPQVITKFLANCEALLPPPLLLSMPLPRSHQREAATAYVGPHEVQCHLKYIFADNGATVSSAMEALVKRQDESAVVEMGLAHGSSVLCALEGDREVRHLQERFPPSRETAYSVYARVQAGKVSEAIEALTSLGESRPEGWVHLPTAVAQAISSVARLVGEKGSASDMGSLYHAIVNFHNAGMVVGRFIEDVLAGLCDRIRATYRNATSPAGAVEGLSSEPPPRVVVGLVLPMLRAAVDFIGDDANSDTILQLLEQAVEARGMAVPLCTALIASLKVAPSLAIQELFHRVDESTHGVPFPHYYTLCYARDRGDVVTVEHLCAVWNIESAPLLQRQPHLGLAYNLWRCAACGRSNSDRYNYCVCSALRNGFVVCARCGYGQDERWASCRSCGVGMAKETIAAVVPRKAWGCPHCRAHNPARQVLACFRCGKRCGPLLQPLRTAPSGGGNGTGGSSTERMDAQACRERFCRCVNSVAETRYAHRVGHCPRCGVIKMPHAAQDGVVWRCTGCKQMWSSLQRSCPRCPQVDCLPAAVQANPIVEACEEPRVETGGVAALAMVEASTSEVAPPPPAQEISDDSKEIEIEATPNALPSGPDAPSNPLDVSDEVLEAPCDEDPPSAEGASSWRLCGFCDFHLPGNCRSAACPRCGGYVALPAAQQEEGAAYVLQTFTALRKMLVTKKADPVLGKDGIQGSVPAANLTLAMGATIKLKRVVPTLEALLDDWCGSCERALPEGAALHAVHAEVEADLRALLQFLEPLHAHAALARRAAALLKRYQAFLNQRCGLLGATCFHPEEVCHECLGGHPPELCFYRREQWVCEVCGETGVNKGVGRYLCTQCLTLRPCVQGLFPAECWECLHCRRANIMFESYCIHCDHARPSWVTSRLPTSSPRDDGETVGDERGNQSAMDDATKESKATVGSQPIPFCPIKCKQCNVVYIDLRCPHCSSHLSDAAAQSTVREFKQQERHYHQPEVVVAPRPQDCLGAHENPTQQIFLCKGCSTHDVADHGNVEPTCVP
ncbi:unnamed protein product [Phytomonas sp. EM1]|nr:unnamed protein product [Phytomonas sp. EM1]|eukprot:CCW65608.1 unnamed protein product [Phytomonas sp. isolate EM1]